jgi:hypothetical protein
VIFPYPIISDEFNGNVIAGKSNNLNHLSPTINIERIEIAMVIKNTINRFFMIEVKTYTKPEIKIIVGKQIRKNEVMYG